MQFTDHSPINTHQNIQTLVLCLDFDGCTDRSAARNKLLDTIIAFLKKNDAYKHILIVIGSLRQSIYLDISNAARFYDKNGQSMISCSLLGGVFITDLLLRLKQQFTSNCPTVEFHPLLLSDVCNELTTGSTYNLMDQALYSIHQRLVITTTMRSKNRYGEVVELCHWQPGKNLRASCLEYVDESKTLMIYMFMHDIALKLGHKSRFRLLFVDDRQDILDDLLSFYSHHAELIPFTCVFQCMKYNSREMNALFSKKIFGENRINAAFQDDLREVMEKVPGSQPEEMKNELIQIHTHNKERLKPFLPTQHYNYYFFQNKPLPSVNLELTSNEHHLGEYVERLTNALTLNYIGAAYALGSIYLDLQDISRAIQYFKHVILQHQTKTMSHQEKVIVVEQLRTLLKAKGKHVQDLQPMTGELEPYKGDYSLPEYFFCPIDIAPKYDENPSFIKNN